MRTPLSLAADSLNLCHLQLLGVEAGHEQQQPAILQALRNYSKRLDTQSSRATLAQFLSTMTVDEGFQSQQRFVRRCGAESIEGS